MSLDYTLNIATNLKPLDLAALVARGSAMTQEGVDLWGLAVNARALNSTELSREIIEEEFGFSPTIALVFHVIPSQGYEEGIGVMAQAVAAILRHVPGDAVLLKSAELMMVQRHDNQVVIAEEWARWFARALKQAGIVFERRESAELLGSVGSAIESAA